MEAVVFQSRTLRFPNLVSFGRRPIFALKEIAAVNSSKGIQVSVTSNGGGNAGQRPPRRSSGPGRTRKNEPNRNEAAEDLKNPKSNNQEEIIALFRKIQTSIAKDSATTKDEDSHEDEIGAESILESLRESRKQVKGRTSKKAGVKVLRRKGISEEPEMYHTSPAAEFKLVRPPSKFVKRSPIPSPPGRNGSRSQLREEPSQAIAESREMKFPSVENMKLTELKAVAKSRGIKGYSKLKKNELLELLRS
ncbi:uncharacterized protein LOC111010657 isoform X2 [Momordica charantia]|uniref:Uncharacterized protein LOC111010657 isoform X2 n=1 Tax=Momordica charantia TaxID=3673 RepID=A0A6J1CGN3_MOMCH|nr:uncharacterized protein LOC111010657 isoform X2 [Momordica charantia]